MTETPRDPLAEDARPDAEGGLAVVGRRWLPPPSNALRSLQTMEERCWTDPSGRGTSFKGRIAKGPAGRKCSTALPS